MVKRTSKNKKAYPLGTLCYFWNRVFHQEEIGKGAQRVSHHFLYFSGEQVC